MGGLATVLPLVAAGFTSTWVAATLPVAAVVAAVGLIALAVWKFRASVAEAGAAVVEWFGRRLTGTLDAASRVAGVFSDSLADKIRSARDAISQSAQEAGASMRGYADDVRAAEADSAALESAAKDAAGGVGDLGADADIAGPKVLDLADAEVDAKDEAVLLTSAVDSLTRRLEATRIKTGETINALVGSQGLAGGFQQAAAGAHLAATSIGDDWLVTLPDAVSDGSDAMALVAKAGGETSGDGLKAGLSERFSPEAVGGVLVSAFTGGGGWKGAAQGLGASMGMELGTKLGGVLTSGLGGWIGSALGAAMPGLGALIVPLAQWIGGCSAGPPARSRQRRKRTPTKRRLWREWGPLTKASVSVRVS